MAYRYKLDQRREERGLSCSQLAEAAGIGLNTLSAIINGHTRPYRRTIYKLAAVLNTTPSEIGFSVEGGAQ